ncbi:potassium channel family protein [Paractinoplanes durhamensis]|uniref:Potassium transporter TrkA n=1 Tax=Paractinoplanes durhamensis TaxID=113563 RepID=A0ABQ3YQB4_9ACTN|nr:NAD-binding protein [Actinoplanes durhamensis]GID99776.1 potassium transporter TrkA [Actinoplanes durhamensis]
MATEPIKDATRRSLVSRLRERNGDDRPHFVVCGSDALVYTVADELINSDRPLRLTVITPPDLRPDVPDFDDLRARGARVITAARLDERTFREAGLADAAGLALVMPDDMVNLHAALCARAVEGDLRLVIRMFATGLAQGVRRLFADCAVLSDATMAAPAFVSAALGGVTPTHFRYAGRTLYVARRSEVPADTVVLSLTAAVGGGQVAVLPGDDEATAQPRDLVLAEATGRSSNPAAATRRLARAGRRHGRRMSLRRVMRVGLTRKVVAATLIALVVTAAAGAVLADYTGVHSVWGAIYETLLTVFGASDVEHQRNATAQAAQVVLTVAGVALLPLITAAIVDGIVKTRLARDRGEVFGGQYADHVVLVGLGNVGTRVLRQLTDLGVEVVAIDLVAEARGALIADQLGVPLIVGDASREETLRAASIDTCRALVVVSTDDAVNLQAALHARAARSDLRVVLRLFDDDFATRVQDVFDINISRSVPRLCAPAFAAALLEREVLATIPVERHAVLVAVVQVAARSELDGAPLTDADRPQGARVICMRAAGEEWVDWDPDPRRVLAPGDEVVVVARRAGLRVLRQQAAGPPGGELNTAGGQ